MRQVPGNCDVLVDYCREPSVLLCSFWHTDKNSKSQDLMGMVQLESSDECLYEDEEEGSSLEGEKAETKEMSNGEASRLDADAGMIITRI